MTQATKLYRALAQELNRSRSDNLTHSESAKEAIEALTAQFLPHGSGFDSGCKIDLDSKPGTIKIATAFHHLNENGYYDGWSDHIVTVTPSLEFGFDLKISGINRNAIKDYISDMFNHALGLPIVAAWDNQEKLISYSLAPQA